LHDDSNTGDITIMKKPFNYPDWRPQKEYRVIIQWRYKGSKLIWIEASTLRCGDLHVACTVIDVKSVYGRERVLVTPVAGAGERWVELTSLVLVGRTDVNRVMGR
jgi:hypothetical protein